MIKKMNNLAINYLLGIIAIRAKNLLTKILADVVNSVQLNGELWQIFIQNPLHFLESSPICRPKN